MYNSANPLIFNSTERAANAATLWLIAAFEYVMQLAVLPYLLSLSYQKIKQLVLRKEPLAEKPHWWIGFSWKATMWMLSYGGRQMLSAIAEYFWLNDLWHWLRPAMVAFTQPFVERFFTLLGRFHGSNVGFHVRDLVIGGRDSWTTLLATPAYWVRDFGSYAIGNRSSGPQKLQENANEAGLQMVSFIESSASTVLHTYSAPGRLATYLVSHSPQEIMDESQQFTENALLAMHTVLMNHAVELSRKSKTPKEICYALEVGAITLGLFVAYQAAKQAYRAGQAIMPFCQRLLVQYLGNQILGPQQIQVSGALQTGPSVSPNP